MWDKVAKKMREKMRKGEPVGFSIFFNFLTGKMELKDADDKTRDDKQAKPRKPKS